MILINRRRQGRGPRAPCIPHPEKEGFESFHSRFISTTVSAVRQVQAGGFIVNRFFNTHSLMWLGALALCLGLSSNAWAAGTPAGTSITNQAFAAYQDANSNDIAGGSEALLGSNIVTTTVLQVGAVVVTPAAASQSVASGGTVYHASQVLNQGNGTDSLDVTYAFENQTGSGTWGDSLYHDVNRNGIFDAGTDTLLDDSGSYTIADLAADSTFYVLPSARPQRAWTETILMIV